MKRTIETLIILIVTTSLTALQATAEWSHDPYENNPVCTGSVGHFNPQAIDDGTGGAIIVWQQDSTINYGDDIFAQRIAANGEPVWPSGGVAICTANGDQKIPRVVSDSAGGAIIAWQDDRGSGDIYAQRVNALGTALWSANGIPVCDADEQQWLPEMISDGTGGAIIVWGDFRWWNEDIRAQRIDGNGTPQWAAEGVFICIEETADQTSPVVTGDGAGGAFIAWVDARSDTADIYTQHVSADGIVQWTPDGVAVCSAVDWQNQPLVVCDGAGGAILSWRDFRSGTHTEIYAQRLDSSGGTTWSTDGIPVQNTAVSAGRPDMVVDGSGGVIITWSLDSDEIRAQRINCDGLLRWGAEAVTLCAADGVQTSPRLIGDGAGGAIVSWKDYRDSGSALYTQSVDAFGICRWADDGIPLTLTAGLLDAGHQIASLGGIGFLSVWEDDRSGGDEIYTQRVDRHGFLGDASPVLQTAEDVPDDQGGVALLNWSPGYLDHYPYQTVTHYSVWMRQPDEEKRSDNPAPLARWAAETGLPPEDVERLDRDGWAYVDQVTAHYWEGYACQAPTYGVYTGSGEIPWTEYMVLAHTADQWVYWESTVVSGYSVDNLSPGAPLDLTGSASGSNALLGWSPSGHHDEDLSHYAVYRGTTPGFTPDQSSLIGTTVDAEYTDPAPGPGTFHYKVTAVDVHGNEGEPSNEASAAWPSDTVTASLGCAPSFGILPFQAQFTLGIDNLYDGQVRRMAGRIDFTLANGSYFPNWRAGHTNIAPSSSFTTVFGVNFPALATLTGNNSFVLTAVDVTPAPYNLPPYPPAGDSDTNSCLIIAVAP